ncbi:MAG: DapH/DapD/GlmU-related protein [Candidatus Omnitrophota bacterium]
MKDDLVGAFQVLFTLFMYLIAIIIIGLSIFPGVALCLYSWKSASASAPLLRVLLLCVSFAAAYFIYGLCVIFIAGIVRVLFGLTLREGEYPMTSSGALKWVLTNGLVTLVANTFMDFMILTPFMPLFYRLMGSKVGKNVQINSKYCADLSLLELEDGAVIGGHATVIGHSFERGRLILKKVKIGKHAVIGLNSVVLPGCQIGDGALIAAGAVLQKNTVVEARDVFFGVPAMSAKDRHKDESK